MALDPENPRIPSPNLIEYAAIIVQAYVGNNRASASEVAGLVRDVHGTLAALAQLGGEPLPMTQKPAVPIKRSITPDYVICLEDGKKLKMLKRYLRTRYKLTTDEYRAKWGLPADYPMVAPNYSTRRSEFAKKFGLGRKQGASKKRKRSKA
jgi:predicted transcriptional regulator